MYMLCIIICYCYMYYYYYDFQPESIHQRSPCFLGSAEDVDDVMKMLQEHDKQKVITCTNNSSIPHQSRFRVVFFFTASDPVRCLIRVLIGPTLSNATFVASTAKVTQAICNLYAPILLYFFQYQPISCYYLHNYIQRTCRTQIRRSTCLFLRRF